MARGARWSQEQHDAWKRRASYANAQCEAPRGSPSAPPADPAAASPPKFGNKKTNGYDSAREAKHAEVLHMLEKCGEITELREQVVFVLIPAQEGERACTYKADFVYRNKLGELVVDEVKGYANDRWPIKRKLMLRVHGIKVREV